VSSIIRSIAIRPTLTFIRQDDGSVVVCTADGRADVLPANEWSRVVSTMCDDGESPRTWQTALSLHTRRPFNPDAHLAPTPMPVARPKRKPTVPKATRKTSQRRRPT
jgi:hypothetical protein